MKASTPEFKHFGRLRDRVDLQVSRSAGPFVFDQHGKKYLDFVAGWCVGNFGWDFEPTREQISEYAGPQYVHPGCSYAGWVELARLLDAITPSSVTKSFRATGGTEAVDLAMQAAMLHTKRRAFVSLDGAYHGNSLATLGLGSSTAQLRAVAGFHKVPATFNDAALERIETRLKKRDVAAVVLEPIAMNLGVAFPEPGFMKELMRFCRKHGTLLIADEVACGFGRTGRMFACDHDDVNLSPDILVLAKALAGGAAPIGAAVMSAAVARSMEREGSYWSTYGWHPLSVSVAIATIRWLRRNEKKLMAHVNEMSEVFRERLTQMPFTRALRIRGLAIAAEVDEDLDVDALTQRCLRAGLFIDGDGDTLMLLPPLTVERDDIHRAMDILLESASA